MKAIRIQHTGAPDVMQLVEIDRPAPGPSEALVRVHAAGINYIDVYYRMGWYSADLPLTLGVEGAGVIEAVGPGLQGFHVGDSVAWCMYLGAYAEYAVVPERHLVRVPQGLDLESAAGALLQGMTAHYLTRSTYPLQSGETALIHAAAGGVGLLLTQMAAQIGARVIATVSSEAKAALARAAGAHEIIFYEQQDVAAEVKRLTDGRGVHVVYDAVGRATFEKSLASLRPRGLLVIYGAASGPAPAVEPSLLAQSGSLFLTRPSLAHYTLTRQELDWRASEVYAAIQQGKLHLRVERRYPLVDVAHAHRELEARRTTGKGLLIP